MGQEGTASGYPAPSEVQSLLLSRDYFQKRDAQAWATRYGYRDAPLSRSDKYYRIPQGSPRRFKPESFRTIAITKGVKAIIGRERNPSHLGKCDKYADGNKPDIEITTQPASRQTSSTIKKIATLARKYGQTYKIRHLATQITKDVPSGDKAGELRAIYQWVRDNIKYRFDPVGIEWLQTPTRTLQERSGDCDCLTLLIASLASSLGHALRYRSVGPTPKRQKHIAVEAHDGQRWISLDPVMEPPGNPNAGTPGRLGARANGKAALFWSGTDGRRMKGDDMALGRPVPEQLVDALMRPNDLFPHVPVNPNPPPNVPLHPVYRAKRWDKVVNDGEYLLAGGDIDGNLGGFMDIVKSAVSFIPGVGPAISTAITVGEEVVSATQKKKKKKAAKRKAAAEKKKKRKKKRRPKKAADRPAAAPAAAPAADPGMRAALDANRAALNAIAKGGNRVADLIAGQAAAREKRSLTSEARTIAALNQIDRAKAQRKVKNQVKKLANKAIKKRVKKAERRIEKKEKKAERRARKRFIQASKVGPYKGKAIQVYDPASKRYNIYALNGWRPNFTVSLLGVGATGGRWLGAAPVHPWTEQKAAARQALKAVKTFARRHGGKPPGIKLSAVRTFQKSDGLLKDDSLYGSNTEAAINWYVSSTEGKAPTPARSMRGRVTWIAPHLRAKPAAAKPAAAAAARGATATAKRAPKKRKRKETAAKRRARKKLAAIRAANALKKMARKKAASAKKKAAAKEEAARIARRKAKRAKKRAKARKTKAAKRAAIKAKRAAERAENRAARERAKAEKAAAQEQAATQAAAAEKGTPAPVQRQVLAIEAPVSVAAYQEQRAQLDTTQAALKKAKRTARKYKRQATTPVAGRRRLIGSSATKVPGVPSEDKPKTNPMLLMAVMLAMARR